MLRAALEMIPFGVEEKRRTIGAIEISNIGGDETVGEYQVQSKETIVFVKRFQRKQGAWSLLKKALVKLGY